MADVQPEDGVTRIANRLLEALLVAPFTDTQRRIICELARLTYGWNRTTVYVAAAEVARRLEMNAQTGGFAKAWGQLKEAGVIEVIVQPSGRAPGLYRIGKDYEAWREPFRVAQSRLSYLNAERLDGDEDAAKEYDLERSKSQTDTNGRLASQGKSTTVDPPRKASLVDPPPEASQTVDLPPEERMTSLRRNAGGEQGYGTNGVTESERQFKDSTANSNSATAAESQIMDTTKEAYAIGLTTALNIAATDTHKAAGILATYPSALDCAESLQRDGIPLDFARSVIDQRVRSATGKLPRTASYYAEPIREAWTAKLQGDHDRNAPRPATIGSPNGQRSGRMLDSTPASREAEAASDEARDRYDTARKRAAAAWVTANPDRAGELAAEIRARYAALPEGTLRDRAVRGDQVTTFATAAGFPPFGQWTPPASDEGPTPDPEGPPGVAPSG